VLRHGLDRHDGHRRQRLVIIGMTGTKGPAMLRPADGLEELAKDPRGKYVTGRTWLTYFASHGRFSGTIVWGEPSAADVRAWEASASVRLSAACEPHPSLFDAHDIGRLGPRAFGEFARYLTRNASEMKARITRLAIRNAPTFVGALAAGFTKLVPVPFASDAFTDRAAALSWLGCEDEKSLVDQAEALRADLDVAPIVRRLGDYLARHPSATPDAAARALAVSTRSLQRKLQAESTTFRDELDAARLRLAQDLLRDSNASITAIALEVGLASPQHLSTLFRKLGCESPREWRNMHRR
jgi:AraC-like DNA-binding protein